MKRTPFFLLGAALVAIALVGCESAVPTAKLVKVTISYEDETGGPRHLSPGVWVLVGSDQANPLFTQDSADGKAMGLEALAETGMHDELAVYLENKGMVSRKFDAASTGSASMTSFSLIATPGSKLYFATMVAPSNDWFAAPKTGIQLLDDQGNVNSEASMVYVWDAGTEAEDMDYWGKPEGPDDDDSNVRVVPAADAMFTVTVTVEEL